MIQEYGNAAIVGGSTQQALVTMLDTKNLTTDADDLNNNSISKKLLLPMLHRFMIS
jgi:hypothetical protein